MGYVLLQVALEVPEAAPLPAAVELVLHVAEELLGGGVVDAVPLARHALGDARPLQPGGVGLVLVLPAHVRVHGRRRPVGQGLEEPVEHPVLLGEVRRGRYVARHDLLRAEVEHRGPVGLGAGHLELGDVGAELLPRPLGAEVPRDDVLERAPHEPPVGAVPAAGAPAAYPAPDAHLAHHLEHGLVGHDRAQLGAQAHSYLPVPAAVGGAREYLGRGVAQLGPGRPPRVRQRVVVGRPPEPRALQQVAQGVPLRAQRPHRLGRRPGQSPSRSTRARNFFR